MIEIRGMTPLIQVFDLVTSLRFYRDILGFTVKQSTSGWAWLERGGVELMINTQYEDDTRRQAPDPRRVAAHDDTSLYFSTPDVDATYAYLRAHGVEAEAPLVASYGMKQLYLSDPDGYLLCFQWPA